MAAAVILGVVAGLGLASWWWGGSAPRISAPQFLVPTPGAALAALPSSPYRNTDLSIAYVGSARCIECHPNEHASYLHTAHSRSMVALDQHRPAEARFDHPPSGRRYRVYDKGGELRHQESLLPRTGEEIELSDYAIRYVVGSGRFGHSYLAEDDGFLIQSPVTWYAERNAFGMSPGYDRPLHMSFMRAISTGCLFCHVGAVETVGGNEFRPRITEMAIGCERCHGPGALHVEQRTLGRKPAGDAAFDNTIVNPASLPRDAVEAICQQCHLQADTHTLVRGRKMSDFRPGLPLENFRIEYRHEKPGPEMTVVGHAEQLHYSRCYTHSETLTCTTCHGMHSRSSPIVGLQSFRSVCLQCHQEESCSENRATRVRDAENDCIRCHMPQVPTEIPHVAFTQHRIGVHRKAQGSGAHGEEASASYLATVQDVSHLSAIDRQRNLGLAWHQLARRSHSKSEHDEMAFRSEQMLQDAYEQGVRDPAVTAALAEIAWRSGNVAVAEKRSRETLAAVSTPAEERMLALGILGELRFRQNKSDEALPIFKELTTHWRDPRHWYFLGLCQQNRGDTEAAIQALERSFEIAPLEVGAPAALNLLYRMRGDAELAEERRRWVDRLQKLGR